MHRWPLLVLLALAPLSACKPKEPPPLEVGDSAVETCGGNVPIITELRVSNGGMQDTEGSSYATVALAADVMDEVDHDLDMLAVDLWWETPADGTMDTTREPDMPGNFVVLNDAPCRDSYATAHAQVAIRDGGRLLPDTEYEFAVVVEDHSHDRSAPVIAAGWTPNLDGTDGGP